MKSAVVSIIIFFPCFFLVLLDFEINRIMRENNNYKKNFLHPVENVDSFQRFCASYFLKEKVSMRRQPASGLRFAWCGAHYGIRSVERHRCTLIVLGIGTQLSSITLH